MENINLSENQRLEVLSNLSHLLIGKGWHELKKEIEAIVENSVSKIICNIETMPQQNEFLNRKEAAALLQCCDTKFYYLVRDGHIKHTQIGRKKLFRKSELLEHFTITNGKRGK